MIELIIGTPNSGKSKIAEDIACKLSNGNNLIYLATMLIYDEEGKRRVLKHQRMRVDKGFNTIELPYEVNRAIDMLDNASEATVLLECISNLVGNELFENPNRIDIRDDLTKMSLAIVEDINRLASKVKNLIIVTNEFEANELMDIETHRYIELISLVNKRLVEASDNVTRV